MGSDEESLDTLGEGDGLGSSCSSEAGPSWPAASSWQDDDEVHLSMPSSSTTAAKPALGSLVYVDSEWSTLCMRQLEDRLEVGRTQLQTQLHRLERRMQLHMTQVIRQQLQPPVPPTKAAVSPGVGHWAELRGQVDSLSETMQMLLRSGGAETSEMRKAAALDNHPAVAARVDVVMEELTRLTRRIDQVEKVVEGECTPLAAPPLPQPPCVAPLAHGNDDGARQLAGLAVSVQELDQRWQAAFSRQARKVEDLYGQVADLYNRLADAPQSCFGGDAEFVVEQRPQPLGAGEAAANSELVMWRDSLEEEMAHTRLHVAELDARTAEMQQSLQHSSLMQDIHHRVVGIGSRILRLRKSSEENAAASLEFQQVHELVDGVAEQLVKLTGRMQAAEESSAALAQDVHAVQEVSKATRLTASELHKQLQELQAPEVCQSESREQLARLQQRLDELVAASPPAPENSILGQQVAELESRIQSTECMLQDLKAAETAAAGASVLERLCAEQVSAQLDVALDLQRGQTNAWTDSLRKLEDRLESVAEDLGMSLSSLQEKQAGLEVSLRDAVVMMYRRTDEQVDSLGKQMDRLQRQAHCTVDELKFLNTQQSELASRFTELEYGYQSRCRQSGELANPEPLANRWHPAPSAEASCAVVKAEPDSKPPGTGIPDLRQRMSSLDSQLSRLHSRRQVSWLERSADGL